VAALVEHGARIAASKGKLSTRFGRLADIAREASFLARKQGHKTVAADGVREAIRFGKRRADLPARHFRRLVAEGTLQVQVQGAGVGQVNGLAVIQAGPLVYGFPARITATIGPGTAGVINIEREADMSGAIHTKGFYILGGLLRTLLRTDHPLAFDASVAFEQSYGGIDGDSASGAEVCCLLSALTDITLSQEVAMTGAIDQVGNILAVGGVNEKIEGFFDTCQDQGLTGRQGVIIPRANAGDLMLREDVVEACDHGRFRVFAVATVPQALEVLSGMPAGVRDKEGRYPEDSVLGVAVSRARRYWEMAARNPRQPDVS
jgi:ATP-dependent Lon protease